MKDVQVMEMYETPLNRLEIAHTSTHVPNRKKNTSERKTQYSWEMEVNIEDMEVDDVDQVPNRGSIQMVQVKIIAEELSHDEPTIFGGRLCVTP
jgi:hypothetical protein